MFLGKIVEEDLTDVKIVWRVKKMAKGDIQNNIEPLLVAVRTSRTITHKETVDPKEFKKTK